MPQKQFSARQKRALWTSVALVVVTALAVITWLPGWEDFRKPSSDVSAHMNDGELAAATATMQPMLTLPVKATPTPRGMTPAPTDSGTVSPTPKNGTKVTATAQTDATPTPKPTRTPAGMTAAPTSAQDSAGASGKLAAKAGDAKATPTPKATKAKATAKATKGKATATPQSGSSGPVSDARSVSLQSLTLMDNRNARIIVPTLHGFANQSIESRVNEGIESRLGVDDLVKKAEKLAQENTSGQSWEVSLRYKGERIGQVYHICATSYTYEGGTHGTSNQTHLYIDATTGTFYSLDDLFTDPATAKKQLTDEFDAYIKAHEDDFLDGAKAAPLPDNFIIEDGKLVIVYPMYSIAPYIANFPEFEIEYARLEPVLNREGTFWKALTIRI